MSTERRGSNERIPFSLSLLLLLTTIPIAQCQLREEDRMREYHLRNYTWPREFYNPPTKGWKQIYDRRFAQVSDIPDTGNRYEGYKQICSSAITAPTFTEFGFAVTRAPKALVEDLREAVMEGLPNARLEGNVEVIEGGPETRPLFIDRPDLMRRVLHELLPMHEAWIGKKLRPNNTYGFRLYRPGSNLHMHVDKPSTHIISSILHIDHSENSKPWPILIEDFQGNTNEVYLESGDMLFYESSKCFHGRPIPFEGGEGAYYTSVFSHYYPEGWVPSEKEIETHYAVPPIWGQDPNKTGHRVLKKYEEKHGSIESRLEMAGTGIKEPECENDWCALKNTQKYYGPFEENKIMTTGGYTRELKLLGVDSDESSASNDYSDVKLDYEYEEENEEL
eukprot:CAMPEP_0178967856 /NCGR_PEP_ID=MMETSP0789-20121207/17869_1 /TAXON_ID=3005 /ORGANISM="Rhizosolenia setigera, Strain CCMP 1694" /LENGTH=391 /DNA_ID=CAMNT_0020653597 /DNA_START=72 /DNA_END=1247 /DNA_ORIENTATION=+